MLMAKILLVEDDNNLREIYEARLQAEGYTIVSARDGEEALVVAKAEKPDLVISDVMMPKISGFEMLDILRNTEGLQHVKVIMLTALGQSEDQKRADSLGADRYLVKSQVTLEDIVNVSQTLLAEAGAIEAPVETPEPAAEPAPAAPEPVAEPVAVTPAPTPLPEPAAAPEPPVIPLATEPVAVADAPVADEPAPTPVFEPDAPVDTAAEPTTTTIPVSDGNPQTSAEEEATVEQQIETFVSTQPGTAPTEVEPTAGPENIEPETTQPETAQEQEVAEAAQNLSGEAPAGAAPEPELAETSETGTHKKVIQPLSDTEKNKKSLDQLLAEEDAKQTGATAQPEAPASEPKNPNDFDPNSIAL